MRTERDKMLAGELYNPTDPDLRKAHLHCRDLCHELNTSRPSAIAERERLGAQLFGSVGEGLITQTPFACDYGKNIYLGNHVFFNFDCVILDVSEVRIGDFCRFGPKVQIYTATHPMDAETRRLVESGRPVSIGDDVWVGGGAIISPGVTIGARSVIGAGSVVTRDIPADVFAAGNPCRVIRRLDAGERPEGQP